jgi:hypothetical protein
MAKTLRTSGDYTVKAGAGYDSGSGTNTIRLDAKTVRIPGDLTVEGTQTTLNSQNADCGRSVHRGQQEQLHSRHRRFRYIVQPRVI